MNIVKIKVEDLIPYINNPRNNENAVDKVASSIAEFGFKNPIFVDKNNVVVNGHTRLLASKKLGLKEVPCIVIDDLSEAQVKAFRIADNKVSEYSKWDYDLLNIELEQLNELDFNMSDFGFNFYIDDEDVEEVYFEEDGEDDEVKNTYIEGNSFVDDLMTSDFYMQGKVEPLKIFNITFTFPSDYKKDVLEYIKEFGKDSIVNDIIDKSLKLKEGK